MSLMQPKIRPIFFINFDCRRTLPLGGGGGGGLGVVGYGSTGLLSGETEALRAKLSKRAEAATSSYSGAVDFLQYIY